MLAITILGAAVGIVLGSQFKMLVLGPAIFFAFTATVAAGFVHGINPRDIALTVLAILASLEFGYVVGGCAVAYLNETRLPHRTWRSSQY
jgi:hypothetical protein